MSENNHQLDIVEMGVILGRDLPTFDISSIHTMEELMDFTNNMYGTTITMGMDWETALTMVKKAITSKRYDDAMASL